MKIRSKFKDYYDFVSQTHFSSDPKERIWIREPDRVNIKLEDFHDIFNPYQYQWDRILVCMGDKSVYILVQNIKFRTIDVPRFSTQDDFDWTEYDKYVERNKPGKRGWWSKRKQVEPAHKFFPTPKEVIKLQMENKCPVIVVRRDVAYLNAKLADLKIQKLVDPYQLYQDLDAWFSDGKFDAPPPEKQNDKQKVISHGFDIVKSFRHRK